MKYTQNILFIFLFCIGVSLPLLASAATSSELTSCPDDYYSFILDVRSENTRKQTIKDFFTVGYCQLNDLMILDQELDDLRENFRAAAFNCSNTQSYKEDYQRILMEQYFVRNIQNTRSDIIREVDVKVLDGLKEEKLDRLKEEMTEIFVDKEERVSKGTFDDYFDSWTQKYDDRIANYNQCDEGAWAEVKETWDDFVETMDSMSIDVENPGFDFNNNISIDNDLGEGVEDFDESVKPVINAWEYLKSLREQGEAKIENPATIEDLSSSGDTYSIVDSFDVLSQDELRYEIAVRTEDRLARYKLLYGEGGAVAATDMQRILEELNAVVNQSNTKDFPNILTGISMVYDKQCN